MRKAVEDAEAKKSLDETREHQLKTHPHTNEVEVRWVENRSRLASRADPLNTTPKTEEEIKKEFIHRASY